VSRLDRDIDACPVHRALPNRIDQAVFIRVVAPRRWAIAEPLFMEIQRKNAQGV
jgi:hypothetical protein